MGSWGWDHELVGVTWAIPSPALALAGWCPLSPAGAQTTQLLVEPPWRPAVLWDRVTLTCQGSGTVGSTTWYKDGRAWGLQGRDHVTVTKSGIYECDRPGSGRSHSVSVLNAWALLEGDRVTLCCQGRQDNPVTRVQFYHNKKDLRATLRGTELSMSPLQLHHSGRYSCGGLVGSFMSWSPAVTVTVHGEQPHGWNSNLLTAPKALPCPLSFSCNGENVAETDPLNVTVLGDASPVCVPAVPVANATITPGPLSHQVPAGDNVTLRCSVQVGSAPVTFTWLRNRQEVARGPLLELRDIDVGHSGIYQCMATNQLGQDRHRVFRELSPENLAGPWMFIALMAKAAFRTLWILLSQVPNPSSAMFPTQGCYKGSVGVLEPPPLPGQSESGHGRGWGVRNRKGLMSEDILEHLCVAGVGQALFLVRQGPVSPSVCQPWDTGTV
uniref:Ig-like domain-containing protein n=1 Tax=Serinus canaria TaxID=9135 RepID=A0A8C9NA35_SERCA